MTAILWINVLLAVPFIALWAGIPLWLVLKRSEPTPETAVARVAAPAALPGPRVHAAYRRAA